MVTLAPEEPKAPTKTERADAAMRSVIAGNEQGAVRRIVLYLVLFAAIGIEYAADVVWISVSALVVALVAAVLLIATDRIL